MRRVEPLERSTFGFSVGLVLLLVLNGFVLLWTLVNLYFWPLRVFYTLQHVVGDLNAITHKMNVLLWWTAGPLLFATLINLCWFAYAVSRWFAPRAGVVPPLPEDAGERFQAPATQSREGPSPQIRPAPETLGDSP
jgi:hypothetical protein